MSTIPTQERISGRKTTKNFVGADMILRLLRDFTGPPVGRVYLRNYFKFSRHTGEQGKSRKSRSIRTWWFDN